jgi:oligopeptide/dipeptide ABC transporter ATP-binding protein
MMNTIQNTIQRTEQHTSQRVVDVDGLDVVYHTHMGPLQALDDVTFHVNPGEIVGLVGESGCGKSTVASTLLQLLPPNGEIIAGQMRFNGRDLRTMSGDALRELRGREITMIFQDPTTSLNPVFTVGAQMMDIQLAHPDPEHPDRDALRRRSIEMLEQVGIPDATERIDHYPHQFSGGMRQRIMIAMALLSRPALLVADEPTSSLDVTLEAQILELIKELRQLYQTSILFISHDLGVIAQLCDRVVVMYAGRVVEEGDVFQIFEAPQHPYTRALLASVPSRQHHGERLATIPGRVPSLSSLPPGCKFADRCPQAASLCFEAEPYYLPVDGRNVRCHRYDPNVEQSAFQEAQPAPETEAVPREQAQAAPTRAPRQQNGQEPLMELQDLSTYFYDHQNFVEQLLQRRRDAVHAVDGVDLKIMRGEILGLVGESGCGKTTLGKTILGLVEAARGQAIYDGKDVARMAPDELRRLRAEIQMIFQDPYSSLSPRLRVSYLLTEPYGIHRVPPEDRFTASELLEMVELSDELANKYPHELSGGQSRRVGIARTLSLHPQFLVADEPTSGLDVSVAASILNLMKDLAHRLELTYMIITHNLNVVGYIADRVAVMYLGRLVEVGPTHQLFESPAHPYTLALLSAISEPDPRRRREGRRLLLKGEVPSPKNPPPGCRFHTRCPFVEESCRVDVPQLQEIEPGHQVACPYWARVREQPAPA